MTDHALERCELFERRVAGLIIHPVEAAHARRERQPDVADEPIDLRLVIGREVARHVELSHSFPELFLDHGDGELPAFRLFGDAVELAREEVESTLAESLRQVGREVACEMILHPELPVGDRNPADELCDIRNRTLVSDDETVGAREAGRVEEDVPVEAGGEGLQFGVGHGAHRLGDTDRAVFISVRLGDAALEGVDAPCAVFGVWIAEQIEDGGDVAAVGSLQGEGFDAAIDVIAVIWHAKASLRDPDGVAVRIIRRGVDADAEGRIVADDAHQPDDILIALRGAHAFEMREQRFDAACFDGGLIHGGKIDVGDLLLDGSACGFRRHDPGDQATYIFLDRFG